MREKDILDGGLLDRGRRGCEGVDYGGDISYWVLHEFRQTRVVVRLKVKRDV